MSVFRILMFFCLLPTIANAKIFQTKELRTDIPDTWICFQENTAYICRSPDEKQGSEAIMIINIRTRGIKDNLAEFRTMLSAKRTIYDFKNRPLVSTVYSVSEKTINNHIWIESTQFNSEIPDFYSFYYATINEAWNAAVLVNFNVNIKSADAYKSLGNGIVQGLRFLPVPAGYVPENTVSKTESPFQSITAKTQKESESTSLRWWLILLTGVFALAVAVLYGRR